MNRFNRILSRCLLITLAVFLFSALAPAQTFRGTILGTVTDTTNASIAGAKVEVKNEGTAQTRTTTTGAAGTYNVPELPIGKYSVTVSMEGFDSMTEGGVNVTIASEQRVDVTLKPGRVSSTVEVTASAPMVATTEDTLGGTLQSQSVDDLPVNGRDYTKLIYLQPGVSGGPDMITDSPGSFGEFSVNGARGRSNNFLLDGTDMNDGYRNDPAINQAGVFGTPATILPVDAVAELAVLSNFAPEYGRNAGGVVNIVTKSGSNTIHGTAADYFRNDAMDARNFFNTAPTPKSAFHNNQFGGSLGGPIVKDKAFFFGDYEGQRETGGLTSTACVPSQNNLTQAEEQLTENDESVNPVIMKLLALNPWPQPNSGTPDSCASDNNLSADTNFFNSVNSLIAKADYNINQTNMLTARYYYSTSNQSFPLGLGGTGDLPGYNTVTPTNVNLLSVSYLTTLSFTKVNEVRFGFNRFYETFIPQDSKFNPASIGLDTGVGSQDYGMPKISIEGYTAFGSTSSDPRGRTDENWQFIDDFSWKLNKHSLKFGFEFRRTTVSQFFDEGYRGSLSFDNLADFLQGMPIGGSILQGDSNRNTFQNSFAFYAQDSFRITHKLTFSYGLRWDYFGVIGEEKNLFSNFNPASGVLSQVGTNGLSSLYRPDFKNFAPRASFAYDVTGKGTTVIRTGGGVFYDVFSQDFFLGQIPYNAATPGAAYNDLGPEPILSGGAVGQIISGQPVYTGFGTSSNLFAVDQHLPTPYMYNYNFNIQQQLGKPVVLEVGYVGSAGHHLFRFRDINQQQLTCQLGVSCSANFPYPDYGYINYLETSSNSIYNALQTQLRIRNMHGFESTVNYNYSHSIDNASDGTDFEPNAAQPNDSYRPDLERGNSNFDVRQRLTWMANYKFPTPKGSTAAKKLLGGWSVSSVLTAQTGQPFQLNFNYSGDWDGSGEYFPRPDVIGNPYAGRSFPNQVINLSAFKVPCQYDNNTGACVPGTQHFGSEGRNSLWGPPFKQWDVALSKDTAVNDRLKVQFRADFFNVINHPNFTNPFLPTFFAACDNTGIDSNGHCQGYLPTTATGDVGEGNPFIGGGGPRGIQLALKLMF